MSEYQYYEFQAIDGRLSAEQLAELRKLSSRVDLTATRAIFAYSYGDFRGDPLDVLERNFDALLYIANWGSRQLAFRFPPAAINVASLTAYTMNADEIELKRTAEHIVLNLDFPEGEPEGWIEGEGLLEPLLPLRDELLRGDLRMLYLAWLRSAQDYDQADAFEPPVPAGLAELSPALQAFAGFLGIDDDNIAAAAEASSATVTADEPLEQWITLLPAEQRDVFLLQLARGEPLVRTQLLRRLREVGGQTVPPESDQKRRNWSELAAAAALQRKHRLAAEREAAEQERIAKLNALAAHEEHAWLEVDKLLAKRSGSGYDQAVELLAELHALARHRGDKPSFDRRMAAAIAPVASSAPLQRRLRDQKLVQR